MKTELAEKLSAWRKRRGLSQRNAALVLGVNKRTLQGWEIGRPGPPHIGGEALLKRISGR